MEDFHTNYRMKVIYFKHLLLIFLFQFVLQGKSNAGLRPVAQACDLSEGERSFTIKKVFFCTSAKDRKLKNTATILYYKSACEKHLGCV